ncbi:tetratricopeptide repeat protein [Kaistella antarctica]|uniref:ATP-dependent transcriptional regulator n=1 Tax=Kaistella antarctica TaxID=266748 RepID=A0A3S4YFS1_9FLAO|nr:tetratricopeptide repeat protein [Kaistella antarctica]KEY20121.1 hypothetical protein HY04_02600 [Kaistella antarctica]SEV93408.1 Tetratricopeptide repeat-containing protein [Kaistella antarctica]VEH95216.1 ATP-dependent transcriptional regulator [Kaistella antarctica]
MVKKKFLILYLFWFALSLQAQIIHSNSSGNKRSDLEKIINQHDRQNTDTIFIKNFLQPLKDRSTASDVIIYNVLLGNSYAKTFDRLNPKSDFHFKKSIRNAKTLKSKPLEVWAALSYAEYLYNFRQMTDALPVFMSVIDMIEQNDPKQLLFPGHSFTKIGFYLDTIGDHPEAIKNLHKALKYSEPNTAEYAAILDNLGLNYLKTGNLEEAEKHISQASSLSQSIGDQIRYAKTLGNLAQIYEKNKDYEKAIKLALEDIRISEQNKDVQNTMYAYTLLTRLYSANMQIDEAKKSIEKADLIAKSKPYFKINELAILKLKLNILQLEGTQVDELGIRRRIEILEDSLNKSDGALPLNQSRWMVQKRKLQKDIDLTNKKLSHESLLKNIIFSVSGLLIIALVLISYAAKRREQKKQVEIDEKIVAYESAKLNNEKKLLDAHRTLDTHIEFFKEKNIQIQKLYGEIENIKGSTSSANQNNRVKLDDLLKSHLMTEENWRNFKNQFQREHAQFYGNVLQNFPEITDSNLRIILLQKLGFTNSEIAGLLGITIEAVKKSKQRLKRKLGEKHELLFQMIAAEK